MDSSLAPSLFSSEEVAARIAYAALPRWHEASGGGIKPAKVRENAVFRVTNCAGSDYALRIHRPGYHSDAALHSEFIWMKALRDSGVLTPNLVRSRDGLDFEILIEADTRYQIDLFEWIDSTQPQLTLGGVDTPTDVVAAQYRMMGETMARVHQQSARWTPPDGFVRHAWDAAGLVGESPLWGRFWELRLLSRGQCQLMEAVRAQLRSALGAMATARDSYGVIHADLMPDNVIVASDGLYLIDFDDAGFGWYLFDIAVALFSFSNTPGFETIRAAFVQGYRSRRTLGEADLALLPLFLAARGTTLLGWLHSRQQSEGNARAPWLIDLACTAAERWLTA